MKKIIVFILMAIPFACAAQTPSLNFRTNTSTLIYPGGTDTIMTIELYVDVSVTDSTVRIQYVGDSTYKEFYKTKYVGYDPKGEWFISEIIGEPSKKFIWVHKKRIEIDVVQDGGQRQSYYSLIVKQ
jgi:hypothetical protein